MSSQGLLYKGPNPICGGSKLMTQLLPKAPFTVTLGIFACEFGELTVGTCVPNVLFSDIKS